VKQIVLNKNVSLCQVAFGGTKRNDPKDHEEQFKIMDRYVELGGNTFDSARVYGFGNSDLGLGRWLKSRCVDRSSVRILDGFRHYIGDVRDTNGHYYLRMVGHENMPHLPTPAMLNLAWEFMSRFARNLNTGEIRELW